MNFSSLENEIHKLVQQSKGSISLHLKSGEGEIKIQSKVEKSAASIIKLPIAMACLTLADEGKINLEDTITINHPVAGTGVINYLYDFEDITLKNAIALSIIVSDNIAANIVIDAVGIENANQFFKKVGATNTHLKRAFMDHESLKAGIDNITTAKDMGTFLQLLDEDSNVLSNESKGLIKQILQNQQLKDKLPSYQNMFAETITIGNKTGTLNGVEHDIAYFENKNTTTYIAVLTTDWEYNYDGQQAIAQIGQKLLEYMS